MKKIAFNDRIGKNRRLKAQDFWAKWKKKKKKEKALK